MTRQRTRAIRIFAVSILLIAALNVPLAFATPPQHSTQPTRKLNTAEPNLVPPLSFLPAVSYSTGGFDSIFYNNPTWVSLADVRGNGRLDVLVANVCSAYSTYACPADSNIGVLLNNGNGTFQPVVTYPSGGYYAFTVIAADVNGDGKPDLLVANGCYVDTSDQPCPTVGSVGVLLGNGDGTFQKVVNYSSGGLLSWIAVADVNGDGKPDLLVSNQDGGSNGQGSVGVLLNNGDGTFQPVQTYTSGGSSTGFIVVADVNGDGKPDLLVSNQSSSVGVLLGNGNGTFQPAVVYAPVIAANVLTVADLRNNGKLDLVVNGGGPFDGGDLSVLLGNGDGTFQPAVTYSGGGGYNGPPLVIDLNGDHILDLAVPNGEGCVGAHEPPCVGVLLGNGDGTFQPAVDYAVGGAALVAAADLNGDGKIDLITADEGGGSNYDGSVNVLLGNGDGTFQPAASYSSGGYGTTWVGIGDVNGDGYLDVIAVSPEAGPTEGFVGILINNPGGAIPTSTTVTSSPNPSVVGQSVAFTATVSSSTGPPPNGEIVTFTNGSAFLGTAPLSEGVASFQTSALPAGSFTITAIYNGDANFTGSTSPGIRQTVNLAATATILSSSLNPSIYGQKITWTAKVTTSGLIPPTGKVSFTWGDGNSVGNATLNTSGVATLTRSNLNADPYPLITVYSGDANNLSSSSPVLNQVVQQSTSAATITSSPNPSTQGQAVTFTATISSPTTTPTGPVTFMSGKTTLGIVELSKGKATLTTSTLPVGSNTVTVTYPWNSDIAESSASVTQVVQQ